MRIKPIALLKIAKISGKEFQSQEEELRGGADQGSGKVAASEEGSEFNKHLRKKEEKE